MGEKFLYYTFNPPFKVVWWLTSPPRAKVKQQNKQLTTFTPSTSYISFYLLSYPIWYGTIPHLVWYYTPFGMVQVYK